MKLANILITLYGYIISKKNKLFNLYVTICIIFISNRIDKNIIYKKIN